MSTPTGSGAKSALVGIWRAILIGISPGQSGWGLVAPTGVCEGHGNARLWRERIRSADACWRRGNAGLVALIASLVPAYRAFRLDLVKVLRAE